MSQTANSARLRSAMPVSTKALSISNRRPETRFEVFRLAVGVVLGVHSAPSPSCSLERAILTRPIRLT